VSVGHAPGRPAGAMVWDAAGHLRAALAQGPEPERESSIEFWDRDGAYRAGLGVWPDGGTGIELLDGAGTLRSRIGQRRVEGGPGDGAATLELYGGDGSFKAAMGEYPDGAGRLSLWDADGTPTTGRVA
jgi:hypothetical protein